MAKKTARTDLGWDTKGRGEREADYSVGIIKKGERN